MASSVKSSAGVADDSPINDWITPLLVRYEGPLLRYAQRLMNCPEKARDVVQETFLRLCKQPEIAQQGHVAEWLFTVCRNYALDVKRKEQRMTPAASSHLAQTESSATPPTDEIEQSDMADRVLSLVNGLPENQQTVLMLKFQGSLSYREISGVTGLSITNVGYLIHQGLTSLRRQLKGELSR